MTAVADSRKGVAEESGEVARGLVPALDRAMRIMALLEESPQRSFTITDIARLLGIPKSTTFNICGALLEGQLLRRSRNGLQLGRKLVQLGSAYVSSVNLVGEFYDVCRPVPVDIEATIQLAVLDEDFHTVYLAYQDCNSGLRLGLGGGIGRRVPANCTACGKALLAMLSAAELERRLSAVGQLPKMTRKSITSQARLRREIADAREKGYSLDEEETIPGLSCIATAFATDHAEGGYVAVSISASRDTRTPERKERLRATLDSVVADLRVRL